MRAAPVEARCRYSGARFDESVVRDLLELQAGGVDVHEIILLFRRDAEERLQRLRRAEAERRFDVVVAIAHCLRGSCSSVGAVGLAALCSDLETPIVGQERAASSLLDSFEAELQLVALALDEMFEHA